MYNRAGYNFTFFRLANVSILSVGSAPTERRNITGISAFCKGNRKRATRGRQRYMRRNIDLQDKN